MALMTLFINRPQRTEIQRVVGNQPTPIVLDAKLSESYECNAEATDHPVETDADVGDHIILKPEQFSITGIISETPLNLGASLKGAVATVSASIGGALASKLGGNAAVTSAGTLATGVLGGLAGKSLAGALGLSSVNRRQSVITELKAARDSKDAITIQTGLQQYKDYYLIGVKVDHEQTSGQSIKVTLAFKKLIRASSLTVKVNIPKITSGMGKRNTGKQNSHEPADGKGASLLLQGLRAVGVAN